MWVSKAIKLLPLLASAVAAVGGDRRNANKNAKQRNHLREGSSSTPWRHLQEDEEMTMDTSDSPCTIPYEDALWPSGDLELLRPSYYENCMSSLSVNSTLMLLHIESLRLTFQQYYSFYNIVNDPADSDPANYQPELGYTLFSGPLEGIVNLDAELLALEEDVNANGATAATFWDLQAIFNKLRDAHVGLPAISFPYSTYLAWVIPERNMNNATRVSPSFNPTYNSDGELDLYIVWEYPEGNTEEEKVTSMDNMTPYEFFLGLVSKSSLSLPYQSVGARMNELFKSPAVSPSIMLLVGLVRPNDLLPESFTVKYESGGEEEFYNCISVFSAGGNEAFYTNVTQISDSFDVPGSAFLNFAIAVLQVENVTNVPDLSPIPDNNKRIQKLVQSKKTKSMNGASYDFDQVYNVPDAISGGFIDVAAFKIEDDYAVLKVENFAFFFLTNSTEVDDDNLYDQLAMIEIWSEFTAAAKSKGVKKAIIDISGNGGGVVASGYFLLTSMYPMIPVEVFAQEFDINYNDPMAAYNLSVAPLVIAIAEELENSTDTEIQEYLAELPDTFIAQLFGVTDALTNFCCQGLEPCEDERCQELFDLRESILKLQEFTTGPQLRSTFENLLAAFAQYNPFEVVGQGADIDRDTVISVIRGGVPQNLTARFPIFEKDLYYLAATRAYQNDWQFDEYVVLSDGAAGSTTCIFASAATQVWKNRDLSGVTTPLTTVTYGGTKDPSDTTIAGFPASVQGVKIEYPIITSGLLQMVQFLLPSNLTQAINEINDYYLSFLPPPPYFGESLPSMPVYAYYNYYMDPGALPLQYVKINGDKHIPQVFPHSAIADSTQLAALYKQAASIGFGGAAPEPADSVDEQPDIPPLEDSEDGAYETP